MDKISLSLLRDNPRNARKSLNVDDLAASVRLNGVLEPIIIRKVGDEKGYEVVCGARRIEAARVTGLTDIPAIIMELTNEQAYEVSIIENLQRKDLEPYEEAESFEAFLKNRKDKQGASNELAEKLGIGVGYVLSRVSAMSMPAPVLKAWKEGKIGFGHVQQIMRVRDEKMMRAVLKEALETRDGERSTIVSLKRYIDKMSVNLKDALFDRLGCASCDKCSVVQRKLFGLEDDEAKCNNRECFVKLQTAWLKEYWKETPDGKKLGTNMAVINKGHMYDRNSFYDASAFPKKCSECVHFGSIVDVTGKLGQYGYGNSRVCFGDKSCFSNAKKSADALTRGKASKAKGEKAKKADPNAPRCEWHGAYFREQLYKTKLRELIEKWVPVVGVEVRKVILACLVRTNWEAAKAIGIGLAVKATRPRYMPKDYYEVDQSTIIAKVIETPEKDLQPIFTKALAAVVMEGNENFKSFRGFGVNERRMVADYLGIDLKKEWTMNEEYMDKKTTKEILAIIDKFKLAEDKKFQDYLVRKVKKDSLAKCKKSELVDLVLKSGVKLAGLVPDEILRKEA
jgi:ParB family transcriptional regulator, chromosome partitioning protein